MRLGSIRPSGFIEQHIMTSGEVVLQYLQRMEA